MPRSLAGGACHNEESVINHAVDHSNPAGLFLGGPAFVLFLLAGLATLALLAAAIGRGESLARLGERASARLDQGRAVPTLWGLAACVFLFLLAATLFATKVLALLGILVMTAGVVIISLGLGAAALSLGLRLSEAGGIFEAEPLTALRLGLWTLFLASFLPFLGWLPVLLALASGVGAVLETLVSGMKKPEPD